MLRRFAVPLGALVVVAGTFAALAATTTTPRMHPQSGPLWRTNAPASLHPHATPNGSPLTRGASLSLVVRTHAPAAPSNEPAIAKPTVQPTPCAGARHRSNKSKGRRCRGS